MFEVHSERIPIRKAMLKILRDAWTKFPRLRQLRVRPKRNEIKCAQPHSQFDVVSRAPNAGDNLPQNAGAILKRPAIRAGSCVRTEKLMKQVTVAVLDVDKICADLSCNTGGVHIRINQASDFPIGQYGTELALFQSDRQGGQRLRHPGDTRQF